LYSENGILEGDPWCPILFDWGKEFFVPKGKRGWAQKKNRNQKRGM
jgi:hypothetical protein